MVLHGLGKTIRYRLGMYGELMRDKEVWKKVDLIRADGGPILWAMYHGTHFPILYRFRHRNICVVTSRSNDGQILARLLESVGYQTVSGSSTRGGMSATINMARVVNGGDDAAVAVDGPRGPAWEVKPGIILLGKITGRTIVPVAATPKTFWRFQSWDRFRLPLPCTKAFIMAGEPMHVPKDADKQQLDSLRGELERRMKALHDDLEMRVSPRALCFSDRKPRDKNNRRK